MSTLSLATKHSIPPVRPELVPRPRLVERLNAGMARKLTLVSAPAGYGKTTLLSEWIHQGGVEAAPALPVAWLSLDEADNDPTRFLAYLIGAAQSIVPHVDEDLLGALQSPEPPSTETVLTSLINELSAIPQDCGRCCTLGLVEFRKVVPARWLASIISRYAGGEIGKASWYAGQASNGLSSPIKADFVSPRTEMRIS